MNLWRPVAYPSQKTHGRISFLGGSMLLAALTGLGILHKVSGCSLSCRRQAMAGRCGELLRWNADRWRLLQPHFNLTSTTAQPKTTTRTLRPADKQSTLRFLSVPAGSDSRLSENRAR
jgi:hypothetical protein